MTFDDVNAALPQTGDEDTVARIFPFERSPITNFHGSHVRGKANRRLNLLIMIRFPGEKVNKIPYQGSNDGGENDRGNPLSLRALGHGRETMID
jgi:hypothetical protein